MKPPLVGLLTGLYLHECVSRVEFFNSLPQLPPLFQDLEKEGEKVDKATHFK